MDPTTSRYTITRRTTGTVLMTRVLGTTSEFSLASVGGSPASIDIFPNGLASSGITITLGVTGYSRQVLMTRVGRVRVIPL